MTTLAAPSFLSRSAARTAAASLCPFHDGLATLDALLAELDPRDRELFDAVLDLRSLATEQRDAAACIAQFFRVRSLLDGRHYLAFYRVRCWAHRTFRVEARFARNTPAAAHAFPLDAARVGEVINSALAPLARDGELPAQAHVRFAFASAEVRTAQVERVDPNALTRERLEVNASHPGHAKSAA